MNLIEEIFGEAAALPPAARAAYLNEACAGQLPEVRARVETLLRSHDLSGFMEKSPVRRSPPAPEWETVELNRDKKGARIGPYLLLEQIGEGGFGTVWLAEQERPIQRRVALKIIKPGMDTKEVIARFEQERRALALMDHPNIAKVLDAGSTPWGRAYFVMELVRGIRLTDYCDQTKLPTKDTSAAKKEAIRLFLEFVISEDGYKSLMKPQSDLPSSYLLPAYQEIVKADFMAKAMPLLSEYAAAIDSSFPIFNENIYSGMGKAGDALKKLLK